MAAMGLILGLIPPAGCASPQKNTVPGHRVQLEREGGIAELSSRERDNRFRAVFDQGLALAGKGQYGLALGAFEQALKLRPDSVEAAFNLGACHEGVGDPLRAIELYRRVLHARPDDADCYRNLGTSFIKMYHREKSPAWKKLARDAWRRSLELKAGQRDVEQYLAQSEGEGKP